MRRSFFYIGTLLVTASCKVGPDYQAPKTDMPIAYAEENPEKTFIPTEEDLAGWWKIFNDPFLNELLEESISGNFDYKIALERVCQARSQYEVQFASILPEFVFDATTSRFRASRAFDSAQTPTTKTSTSSTTVTPFSTTTVSSNSTTTGASISPTQSFFQLGFDAIWEIDFFGKLRRASAAAYDTWEAIRETAHDVKITVLSEVAKTYSLICALQEKAALATEILLNDEKVMQIASDQFAAGLVNKQTVESSIASLEADKALLKSIQTELRASIYSLALLLGRQPETLVEQFLIKRPLLMASGKIPAGLPADLLKRRHDIRAAERTMASATEQVGVAVAQLYPSISLTGSSSSFAANPLQGSNIGFASDKANKLFKNSARIWGIGGLLTVPVFDFGKRLSGIDVQLAVQREATLSYQKTVIAALQEVEVSLTAYFNEEEREKSYSIAAASNKTNYDLTVQLFEAGLVDYSKISQSKSIWLQDMTTLTESRQALTQNLISVYKSLGGDW